MKYDLIIFDMDGTILNTLEDLKNSLNYVLQQAGYQTRTLEEVRTFVGNGIRKTIERALPSDIEEEKVDELLVYLWIIMLFIILIIPNHIME